MSMHDCRSACRHCNDPPPHSALSTTARPCRRCDNSAPISPNSSARGLMISRGLTCPQIRDPVVRLVSLSWRRDAGSYAATASTGRGRDLVLVSLLCVTVFWSGDRSISSAAIAQRRVARRNLGSCRSTAPQGSRPKDCRSQARRGSAGPQRSWRGCVDLDVPRALSYPAAFLSSGAGQEQAVAA